MSENTLMTSAASKPPAMNGTVSASLNNPMPRWWVWTFYFTILWAIGYTIAYPAWPLINGATQGLLGWNSRGDIAAEIADAKQSQSVFVDKIANSSLAEIQADPT